MIKRVRILPENIISKIAAGEVVQRPASIVKELVENSIDAGATEIKIMIRNAGKSLIQVIDNGCGLEEDDLILAFERYSTSKIDSLNDLFNIKTLGFRGEALASIASVSIVEVKSRSSKHAEGTFLRIEGGTLKSVEPAASPSGLSITVKNIFYNTPARRKFLKSRATEFRHILEVVKRFALAFSEIKFSFLSENEPVLMLEKGNLKKRIEEIFSHIYVTRLIEISEKMDGLSLNGYIGNLDLVRSSRGEQYLFLNRRWISDRLIFGAVFSAYGNLIGKGQFPFFVLNIGIDPGNVDVNVHPTKNEVKFRDEWAVYNFVKSSVQKSLSRISEIMPDIISSIPLMDRSAGNKGRKGEVKDQISVQLPQRMEEFRQPPSFVKVRDLYKSFADFKEEGGEPVQGEIWQVHNKYIFSQIKSGIAIIDQHVAHERVLYEQALENIIKGNAVSQQLLFPQTVELSPDDFSILTEIMSFLKRVGFELREFGKNTVIIEAVPTHMKSGGEDKIIREIIDQYREEKSEESPMHDAIAKSYACKAAVKGGEKLSVEEMAALVNNLFATKFPYFCPHGRPIILNLTLEEIDKRFGRS